MASRSHSQTKKKVSVKQPLWESELENFMGKGEQGENGKNKQFEFKSNFYQRTQSKSANPKSFITLVLNLT